VKSGEEDIVRVGVRRVTEREILLPAESHPSTMLDIVDRCDSVGQAGGFFV
jgi:hypothetical protein